MGGRESWKQLNKVHIKGIPSCQSKAAVEHQQKTPWCGGVFFIYKDDWNTAHTCAEVHACRASGTCKAGNRQRAGEASPILLKDVQNSTEGLSSVLFSDCRHIKVGSD